MSLGITKLREQLRVWFHQVREIALSQLHSSQNHRQSSLQSNREPLPFTIEQELRAHIEQLEPPEQLTQHIQHKLEASLTEWQTNPHLRNHTFVVLCHPCTNSHAERWSTKHFEDTELPFHIVDWRQRPLPISNLKEKLQHQIGGTVLIESQEAVAIPNLSWCFLRHVEGLDGIDFICNAIFETRQRFWILYANTICWDYLAAISSLETCCSKPLKPYSFSGEELQSWLRPLLSKFSIKFSSDFFSELHPDDDRNLEDYYFQTLAQISDRDPVIATEIFLSSLTLDNDSEEEVALDQIYSGKLLALPPVLPQLPSVDPDDLYILYSLLLHDGLTFDTLVKSLCVNLALIQSRLQKLLQAGIVKLKKDIYVVNPIHYPRLKQSLINNNLIIQDELD